MLCQYCTPLSLIEMFSEGFNMSYPLKKKKLVYSVGKSVFTQMTNDILISYESVFFSPNECDLWI